MPIFRCFLKRVKNKMLRRNPTRIEVKLDDLEEYTQIKKEKEIELAKQRQSSDCHTPTNDSLMETRTRTEMIHERIGYDPKPHPQPTLQGTMAVYKELPGHVYENATELGLESNLKVDNDYVSSFLQRHLPETRLLKGEDKDLKYKTQNLQRVHKRKREVIRGKRGSGMSVKERKRLKLFDIKKEHQTYEKYVPMNEIWKGYINDIINPKSLNDNNMSAAQEKLLKADFHGSCITVQRSKCPSYVGVCGIVLQETRNTFKLITKENQVKCIPKMNCVFAIEIGDYIFTLHGNQFRVKTADRCNKKFKLKETVEI